MAGKQFNQVFAELRGGLVQKQASDHLQELVKRVKESGRKGSITITLSLEPHGKDNMEAYVYAKVTSKLPPAPEIADASVFFATDKGDLLRDHPDQRTIKGLEVASDERDGTHG